MIELLFYLGICFISSTITYFMYKDDKKRAIKNKYRVKERVLLLASLCFGSLGGLLGLYKLRHKNQHWYFVLVNFLALFLHIGIAVFIYIYFN